MHEVTRPQERERLNTELIYSRITYLQDVFKQEEK